MGEPIFFDPKADGDEPVGLTGQDELEALWAVCRAVRVPTPALHAIRKTKAIPGGREPHGFNDAEMEGWRAHGKKETSRDCQCDFDDIIQNRLPGAAIPPQPEEEGYEEKEGDKPNAE